MATYPLTDRAVLLKPEDDVAIAKKELTAGTVLEDGPTRITVRVDIKPGHKVARRAVSACSKPACRSRSRPHSPGSGTATATRRGSFTATSSTTARRRTRTPDRRWQVQRGQEVVRGGIPRQNTAKVVAERHPGHADVLLGDHLAARIANEPRGESVIGGVRQVHFHREPPVAQARQNDRQ